MGPGGIFTNFSLRANVGRYLELLCELRFALIIRGGIKFQKFFTTYRDGIVPKILSPIADGAINVILTVQAVQWVI